MPETLRNIAILAHADAGKTSITEQMLLLGGVIKKAGNVDSGSAFTDFLPVEKERGISVRSAQVTFTWKGIQINLIDTPGHVDFSADVERTLRAVDGAILVISAVEGVQAHTEALYRALENACIPVIIFINKIDRVGADIERVLNEIRKELKVLPFIMQNCQDEGEAQVMISRLWSKEKTDDELLERLVASREDMMNAYFEGSLPDFEVLDQQLRNLVHCKQMVPLFLGSAKYEIGLETLMDAVISYLPPPKGSVSNPLSALVYGIEHDRIMGKIALVRVLEGSISTREVLKNVRTSEEAKVTQIRKVLPGKHEEMGMVEAGNIAGLCGLSNVKIGDYLGSEPRNLPAEVRIQQPLFVVQIKAVNDKEYPMLAAALQELSEEDPTLEFDWHRDEAELQLKMMGWIQMEVMEKILLDRFSIAARFENPTVIYKETPSSIAEGFVRYWMPKPCWAILKFLVEPGERGSGVIYSSSIGVNDVLQKYQNEVERTIPEALKQGIKGWEVTDIKITLIEGEDHEMHSRPGDFVIATPMGIMDGLVNTGTTLLEPMIRFRIQATEDLLGAITSDITRMRGSFESPEMDNGRFILHGLLPVSTSLITR
ncbi:MAG: TetM/TetW/TetO/TetS family tetracycline resistance ribosomal protection protein [Bacteroidales bacterium]|nr:TetM/TetW/TetO/TetS family tetracycline resistance ribosomal protection protein [Bacteroidales bacterium]